MGYKDCRGTAIYLQNSLPETKHIIDGTDTGEEGLVKDPRGLATIESILNHKKSVKEKLLFLARELEKRAINHDNSKLQYPELDWLIQMDKEGRVKYGSKEYFDKMNRWKIFFDHHYKNNKHHPEHFRDNIDGMNLVDLIELFCDIQSYVVEPHVDKALDIFNNYDKRFHIDEQLLQILKNTMLEYFTMFGNENSNFQLQKNLNVQQVQES